ncbi:hypothetical protein GO986_12055 [Deinococcus sp. HMF7620]|uniref:Uncharacterized protein n=1 Tax=Deinococcus arboris TaxID=2682977 RepID=A0A7C9LLH4_9DEIO|nr:MULTISPECIES: hypothetical protein [Deinococcus]MBZ9752150.1 hypothetical protein [Deinococcus betulae]MVN87498.1 hypothetical protein [Deinococcus arboris]
MPPSPPHPAWRSRLRRFFIHSLIFVAATLLFLVAVITALLKGWLSADQTVFILSLGGMVGGITLIARFMLPRINHQRDAGLAKILADVTAQKYKAAPDEAWLFIRRGWWTRDRQLTPAGQQVLASLPAAKGRR